MSDLKEIIRQIEELRMTLHKITEEKTLTDPEVVAISQMLDAVLNEYNKLLKHKADRD
ncbi:MAG: Spo0E family sporulation regulatory protein-aspartic acid phosphatase [Desulfitobacteriaceae bacterium]